MDMLKAILDIEKRAQKITGTFELSAFEENEKTKKMLEALEENEKLKAKEELSAIFEKNEKELKASLEKNFSLMSEKSKALEKTFYKNQKRWIDEITNKITGGDAL